jgi:hypothetical protein
LGTPVAVGPAATEDDAAADEAGADDATDEDEDALGAAVGATVGAAVGEAHAVNANATITRTKNNVRFILLLLLGESPWNFRIDFRLK